jgi:hypothetical protein
MSLCATKTTWIDMFRLHRGDEMAPVADRSTNLAANHDNHPTNRRLNMKHSHKISTGLIAAASLMITAAVYAHPGEMGSGMGEAGAGHPMMGAGMGMGMGHGAMGKGPAGPGAARQLMTPEERTAMREKMHSAKTPEERQSLAAANHAEMQRRAKEKGITLPEGRGPGAGMGPDSGEHKH